MTLTFVAVVSKEFLDYTASQGNDLRTVGLAEGCRWCLCAGRWQEALDAFRAGKINRNGVPKSVRLTLLSFGSNLYRVQLEATDRTALRKVEFKDLEAFKID